MSELVLRYGSTIEEWSKHNYPLFGANRFVRQTRSKAGRRTAFIRALVHYFRCERASLSFEVTGIFASAALDVAGIDEKQVIDALRSEKQ